MSIQIATAASTLRYYGDPEDLEPEVKASIIDSLIDPVENILIAAAHLSDIRNIYFPEKDGFELSERDLMTIAGAYNAGTSYTIDELWEFGFAGGYGRAAVQDRVSEHNLEQLLRGER
ncbi:hypothetical protein [Halomicronema sp. CCY15110]|uniref:hypothetical protein n=1 Tax=Halomicronema sp. CCY15110 TaxID=2767773 RepID=UPI0019507B80|nr:hypothetical protein [Halomicronema sp. CCY15110]